VATLLTGAADRRFYHETRLYYGVSFIRTRFVQYRAGATGPDDRRADASTASRRERDAAAASVQTVRLAHLASSSIGDAEVDPRIRSTVPAGAEGRGTSAGAPLPNDNVDLAM
jgi:hypothetical protein